MNSRQNFAMVFSVLLMLVVLPVAGTMGATHTVNQVGLTFSPNDITIDVGDTVEWVWSTGSHTVTNGSGPADPEVGVLFDQSLNSANPVVTYTFNEEGDYPYFCRPHFSFDMTGIVRVQIQTAVEPLPLSFMLRQNIPNPFNPITRINFSVPGADNESVHAMLRIYDLQGRLVKTLVNERLAATEHSVIWDGRNDAGQAVASGIFAYRLNAGDFEAMRTMTLLK